MQNDSVSVVKTHASILIESLKEQGITIKKTQALEIMSRLENRTDWNRLRARLKNLDEPKAKKPAKKSLLDCMIIHGPAGTQKTETLKALFELEFKDKETCPVMICMSGDGHTLGNDIDHFLHGHARINVFYDEFGISGSLGLKHSPYAHSRGLIINLVSSVKGRRAGVGLATSQFLKAYDDSAKMISNDQDVGTLMIDGFEQIPDSETEEVASQVNLFCEQKHETVRRVVISSRKKLTKSTLSKLDMNILYLRVWTGFDDCYDHKHRELNRCATMEGYDWRSEGIADPLIVEDMYWLMYYRFCLFPKQRDENSRISNIPGRSSWFMDFKSSLIS